MEYMESRMQDQIEGAILRQSEIDDGGTAFPSQEQIDYPSCSVINHHPGMTLRDYFAAKAMVARRESGRTTCEQDAEDAYKMADAMLKARKS